MSDLATRLRTACDQVRVKSYPLSDLIPLMQQAADALAAAPRQPAPSAAPEDPLQVFDSLLAKSLMRAWEEGWEACRDAEYVGEEAQNDAFNSSHTLTLCLAEDQLLPTPQADIQPAPVTEGTPPPCDQELFDQGVSVGLFDIPKWTAEALCRGIAAATEARVDWHYIVGRVHIKALPAARAQADSVLEDAARYRWLRDSPIANNVALAEHFGGSRLQDFDAAIDAARKQGEKS